MNRALHPRVINISDLMEQSGVKFGTSGVRGIADQMTDRVCYIYVRAFIQYLVSTGDIHGGDRIAVAGDFRPSTPRIMAACARAIADAGFIPVNCGFIPTPAVSYYSMSHGMASLMVTGSHIPDDRNGIKFNKPTGEILKEDELGIGAQHITVDEGLFDDGVLASPYSLSAADEAAREAYIKRYIEFFGPDALNGKKVLVYQHSTVARDILEEILSGLGAEVTCLGRSEKFIPVDTEAIRPEDVVLARQWAKEYRFDCIVSADGDGDRPLVSDEMGNWLRGDVAGILCARYLQAHHVSTPVSSNSAVEKCGWFGKVERTRIGSPYVIAAMQNAITGFENVVGYEANGGFLTASDINVKGNRLQALPTRDAVIVPLGILMLAREKNCSVSELVTSLPQRFTYSDRIKNFPTEVSSEHISRLSTGNLEIDKRQICRQFKDLGPVASIDVTDGLRITFENNEVVHLRPSGNAPELRCYTEAEREERAVKLNNYCTTIMEAWKTS